VATFCLNIQITVTNVCVEGVDIGVQKHRAVRSRDLSEYLHCFVPFAFRQQPTRRLWY